MTLRCREGTSGRDLGDNLQHLTGDKQEKQAP
jgi:hypothetical protein